VLVKSAGASHENAVDIGAVPSEMGAGSFVFEGLENMTAVMCHECGFFGAFRRRVAQLTVAAPVAALLVLTNPVSFVSPAMAQDSAALTQAIDLYTDGDYAAAIDILEALNAETPGVAEVHYFLALSKAGQGDFAAALESYAEAERIDPTQPGLAFNRGIAHYTLKDYEAASGAFTDAIVQDPESAEAHLFAGLAANELGEPELAIVSLEQALRLDPSYAQLAHYNIAIAEKKLGRDAQSREALELAIAEDPNTSIADSARSLLAREEAADTDPKRLTASFAVGIEVDDNVTTDEVDLVSAEEDWAYVIDFNAGYELYRAADTTVDIGYSFFQSFYHDQTEFDLQSHNVSATVDHTVGEWDLGLTTYYARTFLNDEDFLGIASAIPTLGRLINDSLYLTGNYTFDAKNFIDGDDRDAIKNGVGIDAFYFIWDGTAMLSAGYDIGLENARSEEFDLVEHKLDLGFRTDIPVPAGFLKDANPQFKLGYRYTWKDYTGVTAAIGKERKDERDTITAGLSGDLGDYAFTTLDYKRIVARSNLQTADFNEDIFTLRVGVRY
jgi:Tfp pilus assembly protein PilF